MKVAGVKFWYTDGMRYAVRMEDEPHAAVETALAALPEHGLAVVMIYFDAFDQTDGTTRLRRIMQGSDFYWLAYDDKAPEPFRDWMVCQSNAEGDVLRYPGARVLYGGWTSDSYYQALVTEAMADFAVTEFGIAPVPGTEDR